MLKLNYSGWDIDYGPFSVDIPFDCDKTDWEIHFSNGSVFYQKTPFAVERHDWNYDGDVYDLFGAWFYENGARAGEFYTPEHMVRLVVDGEAKIPGLDNPSTFIKEAIAKKGSSCAT